MIGSPTRLLKDNITPLFGFHTLTLLTGFISRYSGFYVKNNIDVAFNLKMLRILS